MFYKGIFGLFLTLWITVPVNLYGELIKFSLLQPKKKEFFVKRNLFLSSEIQTAQPENNTEDSIKPEIKKSLEEEILQSVKYEGYLSIDGKITAILNISGETHIVQPQDIILEKIRIVKVEENSVIIDYEGQSFTIPLNRG